MKNKTDNAREKLFNELIENLNIAYFEWEFNEYRAENNKWGIHLWIKNGRQYCNVYAPTEYNFTFKQKRILWKALNECRAKYLFELKSKQ